MPTNSACLSFQPYLSVSGTSSMSRPLIRGSSTWSRWCLPSGRTVSKIIQWSQRAWTWWTRKTSSPTCCRLTTSTTQRTSSVSPREGGGDSAWLYSALCRNKCAYVALTCDCVCVPSDVFKMDPDFLENEEKYKTIKKGENAHKHRTVQSTVASFTV